MPAARRRHEHDVTTNRTQLTTDTPASRTANNLHVTDAHVARALASCTPCGVCVCVRVPSSGSSRQRARIGISHLWAEHIPASMCTVSSVCKVEFSLVHAHWYISACECVLSIDSSAVLAGGNYFRMIVVCKQLGNVSRSLIHTIYVIDITR